MFKSKMIRDPNTKRDNLLGVTVGLVFYAPKFWDCKAYDFYASQFDEMLGDRPLPEHVKEERYQAKLAHENCKRKHLSYRGYMYWNGPKRRYDFYYMGPVQYQAPWWKIFRVVPQGRYVRWFDNGPQNPPRSEFTEQDRTAFRKLNEQLHVTLENSRRQMREYEAKRKAEENG